MKLFSNSISLTMATVIVLLGLAASANGELIFANRRTAKSGSTFSTIMKAYDTDSGDDETPAGFSTSYTTTYNLEGLAYYDHAIYSSGSFSSAGDISVYNATTGQLVNTISVSSTGIARGLVFDADGYLYCGMKTDCKIYKISADGTSVQEWAAAPDKSSDMEIYGNYMYVGTSDSSSYGVWVYDLTSSTPTATLVSGTDDVRVDGIAFTEDGTMYTTSYDKTDTYLRKWIRNSSGSYTEDETAAVTISTYSKDVDYVDGCLYICDNDTSNAIAKYDLSTSTLTTSWASISGYDYCGYLVAVPVPEPGTCALLLSGLIGLLAYAWRKRK